MDNHLIWTKHGETQSRIESIIDEKAEENMDVPNHVYSHHDDGYEDDIGQDDVVGTCKPKAGESQTRRWEELDEGVWIQAGTVNVSNNSLRCSINEHVGSIYRGD
jgi:hypothetical protein